MNLRKVIKTAIIKNDIANQHSENLREIIPIIFAGELV